MEVDQLQPERESLLLSSKSAVYTLNTASRDQHLIAGKAQQRGYKEGKGSRALFDVISGFVQTNRTYLYVIDYWTSVLRGISRTTNTTTYIAGRVDCKTTFDGYFHEACLNYPTSIAMYTPTLLFIAEQSSSSIRLVNLSKKRIKSVLVRETFSLLVDVRNEILYTGSTDIHAYSIDTENDRSMTAGGQGGVDGDFKISSFSFINKMLLLNSSNDILIADQNKLRVVDLKAKLVSSICTGEAPLRDGSIDSCSLQNITAICNWNSTAILISTASGIHILSSKLSACPSTLSPNAVATWSLRDNS